MKIRTRLILGFLIVAILVGVVGYIGFNSIKNVEQTFIHHKEDSMAEMANLRQLQLSTSNLLLGINSYIITSGENERAEISESIGKIKEFEEKFRVIIKFENEKTFISEESLIHEKEEEILKELINKNNELIAKAESIVNIFEEGASHEVIIEEIEELELLEDEIFGLHNEALEIIGEEFDEQSESIYNTASTSMSLTIIISILSLLLAVSLGFIISHSITKPLNILTQSNKNFSKGIYITMDPPYSNDELGEVMKTRKKMLTQLVQNEKELKKGKEKVEQKVKERTQELQKANEQLERDYKKLQTLDNMKDEFLSTTSHELKTPLTSMKGFIQLMLDERLGEINQEQKESLVIVFEDMNRLNNAIENILDLSKLQSARIKFNIRKTNLEKAVKECIKIFGGAVRERGLKLRLKISTNLPLIKTDKIWFCRVIDNLITNSIKFTKKGEIKIEAKQKDNNILISVEDTGIGIIKENLKKIFDKFFQVQHTEHGVGLGLTIAKQIVETFGGKIWAESEGLGKGTTVTFTIPIRDKAY